MNSQPKAWAPGRNPGLPVLVSQEASERASESLSGAILRAWPSRSAPSSDREIPPVGGTVPG